MALHKLKDYGLTFNDLKKVVLSLNETGLVDALPIVGIKGESLLSEFCTAIDSIPDDELISGKHKKSAWYKYYEAIPQAFFDDDSGSGVGPDEKRAATTPKKSKPEEPEFEGDDADVDEGDDADVDEGDEPDEDEVNEVKAEGDEPEDEADGNVIDSDCPTFKTGWDSTEEDCIVCSSDFPEEYKACKAAVEKVRAAKKEGKGKKGKTKTKTKKTGDGTTPKAPGKRTRYGHMPASMAGHIDDMVFEGKTKADMVAHLMTAFKRTKEKAESKVSSHLLTLTGKKGITITEGDENILKATEEFTAGQDATNTVSAS